MGRHATYKVTLTQEERTELERISSKGKSTARRVLFARALLLLDEGEFAVARWEVDAVATAVGMSDRTLEHLKKRFVEEGLDEALERKEREKPSRELKFDGAFEARLTQLACSAPPEGRTRWTIRLLRDKLIELRIVDTVSTMTVWNTLKKTGSRPTKAATGKSLPDRTATSSRGWKTS
jgi:transposase